MTILLHKPYLVKSDYDGGGWGSKMPKNWTMWFLDDPLPGIQGSGEKKVNYELATPLTDTLKEKKTRRWPMKNFRFICGSSVSQYAKCSNI